MIMLTNISLNVKLSQTIVMSKDYFYRSKTHRQKPVRTLANQHFPLISGISSGNKKNVPFQFSKRNASIYLSNCLTAASIAASSVCNLAESSVIILVSVASLVSPVTGR